jgi:hypothetical protein
MNFRSLLAEGYMLIYIEQVATQKKGNASLPHISPTPTILVLSMISYHHQTSSKLKLHDTKIYDLNQPS